jgi:BlaI family penicillinase repressor
VLTSSAKGAISLKSKVKPTELELDILEVLWREGPVTVRQIHEALQGRRPVVYTTILKAMQVMHEKGLLDRNEDARSHVYSPAIAKDDVSKGMMKNLLDRFFEGSAAQLAMHALSTKPASQDEIRKVKVLLEEMEKKKK